MSINKTFLLAKIKVTASYSFRRPGHFKTNIEQSVQRGNQIKKKMGKSTEKINSKTEVMLKLFLK
jgi:hypothetical protein